MDKSILVVEDEGDLAELLCFNLESEGFSCRCVRDGAAALDAVRESPPDLLVLDRMLPGMPGDEVALQVKRDPRSANIPIIMLTAKAEESDELVGFALGADDYVTKPFSMKIFLARVRAVFRRAESTDDASGIMTVGPIVLDPTRHEVSINGAKTTVTVTEFRMLRTLMKAGGRVLDRPQLIDATLGPGVAVTDRTIDVHIAALRKKLGPAAAGWIRTVRGVGYTFREPE